MKDLLDWRLVAGSSLVIVAAATLLATAPVDGDFWWSDAPRHALNGVFLMDLFRDLPLADPRGYAYAYYAKYPALTILFYPPLFYLISVPFYLVFGVTHLAAQLAVTAHLVAFGLGALVLFRRWFATWQATGLALILLALPEIALWGRQVMLEIPSFAFAIWSAVFLLRYCDNTSRVMNLTVSLLLLVCALWIKLSLVFLLPIWFATLLATSGLAIFGDWRLYLLAGLMALGLMPLLAVTLYFGQANLQSVAGVADAVAPKWSLAGWSWYMRQMPAQMGWPVLGAAALGLGLTLVRSLSIAFRSDRVLLLGWLAFGYMFFSLIDLKEARHTIYLLMPLTAFAGVAVTALVPSRLAGPACILGGVAMLAWSATTEVPRYDGYRQAAAMVAGLQPANGIVVFSGKRDGSFIFNVRALEQDGRRGLVVIRADKLLLRIAVRRELGVEQRAYSADEIGELISSAGAEYVVAQDDFWTDLDQMRKLQDVLRSNRFEEVARIPVTTSHPQEDRMLRIYRNLGEVARNPSRPDLDLPIINRTIKSD